MNPTSKKFISLFIIISLMSISCTTMTTQRGKGFESSKERKHGAKLIITKKNGYQTEGELITVKPNSLLLLDTEGKDVSVDITDIKVIRIVKQSQAGKGALYGLLIGGVSGALLIPAFKISPVYGLAENIEEVTHSWTVAYGLTGAAPGLVIGGIIGAVLGTDKTIQIEGMSDLEIRGALDKLRKKARIRDYK